MTLKPAVFLLLLAAAVQAQEIAVRLDPATTEVDYTLGDVLHTVHGTFKLKSGDIRFDPVTGKASGALVVDAASGDSGNRSRDRRMNDNILEASKYPEIRFEPDHVEGKLNLDGNSDVRLHGIFHIHGSDHELTLAAKTTVSQSHLSADIQFPVPYVLWGMKNPSTLFLRVKDTVEIAIHANARIVKP